MSGKRIHGIISPPVVPFTADGEVDQKKLKEYIRWLVDKGVHGLFPLGTYGGGPLMNLEERKLCAEMIIEAVDGRIPVICHIGAQNTRDSIELARHAERIGMDAVASYPPTYYRYNPENVKAYYQDLMNSVAVPVFAYNYPKMVGYEISVDLLAELADIGIAGIKDSSMNLVYLQQAMNAVRRPDFIWISGNPPIMLATYMLGVIACVAGTANAFPEFTGSLWDAIQDREYVKAAELQRKVTRLVELINLTTDVIGIHEILWLRGFDFGGYPRAPLRPYSEKQRATLEQGLLELGLISGDEITKRLRRQT
jgi:N-acetylneuraminate lyase/4-hydroxy-tetrahydrodipicolinate synthase